MDQNLRNQIEDSLALFKYIFVTQWGRGLGYLCIYFLKSSDEMNDPLAIILLKGAIAALQESQILSSYFPF